VLGGLAVTANTTSGDANAPASYTLLNIAAVHFNSMLMDSVVVPLLRHAVGSEV
jgi:hypothetical protein